MTQISDVLNSFSTYFTMTVSMMLTCCILVALCFWSGFEKRIANIVITVSTAKKKLTCRELDKLGDNATRLRLYYRELLILRVSAFLGFYFALGPIMPLATSTIDYGRLPHIVVSIIGLSVLKQRTNNSLKGVGV